MAVAAIYTSIVDKKQIGDTPLLPVEPGAVSSAPRDEQMTTPAAADTADPRPYISPVGCPVQGAMEKWTLSAYLPAL